MSDKGQERELRRRARAELQQDIEELHQRSARLRLKSDLLRHNAAQAPDEIQQTEEANPPTAALLAGRPPFRIVVLVASAGGIQATREVLRSLPTSFPAPWLSCSIETPSRTALQPRHSGSTSPSGQRRCRRGATVCRHSLCRAPPIAISSSKTAS